MTEQPIRLGISRCLLGEPVRYDGGHKRDRFLTDVLGRYVEWVPVCPEVEAGFGTPREAMRLEGDRGKLRLMTIDSRRNMTKPLALFTAQRLDALADAGLSGYIFKKDSPSCGVQGVRVFDRRGASSRTGAGLFARAFGARFPLVPIEDEQRLRVPGIRDHFIERVFYYHRWQVLAEDELTRQAIIHFHSTHKYILMAHGPASCRILGRLVARAHRYRPEDLARRYGVLFMKALAVRTIGRNQAGGLRSPVGHWKERPAAEERENLNSAIRGIINGS